MNKILSSLVATTLAVAILSGCATTSVMGSGFEKAGNDTYVLMVGTGGGILEQAVAAEDAAKSRFEEEVKQFLAKNKKYSNYKITNTERSVFPLSYYKYTVEFK